jgi:hypothetical protein
VVRIGWRSARYGGGHGYGVEVGLGGGRKQHGFKARAEGSG